MLETIILILLVLWAVGFWGAPAIAGSFIHILLVIVLVLFLIRLTQGRSINL